MDSHALLLFSLVIHKFKSSGILVIHPIRSEHMYIKWPVCMCQGRGGVSLQSRGDKDGYGW